MPAARRCASCAHYLSNEDPRSDPPLILEEDGRGFGSCHRYPPTADPVHRLAEAIDNMRLHTNAEDPEPSLTFGAVADECLQPVLIMLERTDSAVSVWPRVHETDWCGEYHPEEIDADA
jgi:hypothetical protein